MENWTKGLTYATHLGKHPLGSNKVSPTLLSYKATEMDLKSGVFDCDWVGNGPRLDPDYKNKEVQVVLVLCFYGMFC